VTASLISACRSSFELFHSVHAWRRRDRVTGRPIAPISIAASGSLPTNPKGARAVYEDHLAAVPRDAERSWRQRRTRGHRRRSSRTVNRDRVEAAVRSFSGGVEGTTTETLTHAKKALSLVDVVGLDTEVVHFGSAIGAPMTHKKGSHSIVTSDV
jgi:hypothetical protein